MDVWFGSGISKEQARILARTHFVVADLEGATLGISLGDTVWIDIDGAGLGWSIDDVFAQGSGRGKTFDLLTVVIHELGHTLGYDHSEGDDVMHATLAPGIRALPSTFEPTAALAAGSSYQTRTSIFTVEDYEWSPYLANPGGPDRPRRTGQTLKKWTSLRTRS
jgi:hypothetical protein